MLRIEKRFHDRILTSGRFPVSNVMIQRDAYALARTLNFDNPTILYEVIRNKDAPEQCVVTASPLV